MGMNLVAEKKDDALEQTKVGRKCAHCNKAILMAVIENDKSPKISPILTTNQDWEAFLSPDEYLCVDCKIPTCNNELERNGYMSAARHESFSSILASVTQYKEAQARVSQTVDGINVRAIFNPNDLWYVFSS